MSPAVLYPLHQPKLSLATPTRHHWIQGGIEPPTHGSTTELLNPPHLHQPSDADSLSLTPLASDVMLVHSFLKARGGTRTHNLCQMGTTIRRAIGTVLCH